ncbi:MAG: hypothetical protein D3903_15570 [Candidatus Electrothrix sp. GM3_4]|nr:hypothetical protein [Candidatus Electrothrix sp. GM3_4]
MNNKKTEHDRVNELRNKIEYAENARDAYKNVHQILYQTNSFYADTLKQELEELEKSIGMDDRNQRNFSRIKIQRTVHLNFCSAQHQGFLDNISLSGSFVKGAFKQSRGDICKIGLKEPVLVVLH